MSWVDMVVFVAGCAIEIKITQFLYDDVRDILYFGCCDIGY